MSNLNLQSVYQNLGGGIVMPEFKDRKLYMHKTRMDDLILPADFSDYIGTVDEVLKKVQNRNDVCYITIDEKNIKANDTHRRGGIHVDFNWFEEIKAHGGSSGSHGIPAPKRESGGHGSTYRSHGQPLVTPSPSTGSHGQPITKHGISRAEFEELVRQNPSEYGLHGYPLSKINEMLEKLRIDDRKRNIQDVIDDSAEMMKAAAQWYKTVENGGMLLVSNHEGCQVYEGDIIGEIGQGGCCANVDVSGLKTEIMKPNDVFYLNALGIHESIPIKQDAHRSLIRIAFHPDYIFEA
jgi:hypothetical protein